MSGEWFYIQRWAEKRWSQVGLELPFVEAKRLFSSLSSSFTEETCVPLALLFKDSNGERLGKVVLKPEDQQGEWEMACCNAMFLMDDPENEEGLLVRRV